MKQCNKLWNLSKAREVANLSQQELADKIGVPRGYVTYWENGTRTPHIEDLIKLCKVLNVSSDYILGLNDNSSTNPDIANITRYTGLNEASIAIFRKIKCLNNEKIIEDCNHFISSDCFLEILRLLFEAQSMQRSAKKKVNLQDTVKIIEDSNLVELLMEAHQKIEQTKAFIFDMEKAITLYYQDNFISIQEIEKLLNILESEYFDRIEKGTFTHKTGTYFYFGKQPLFAGDNNADD